MSGRVLFVNEAFFESFFGVPMEKGKVYAGDDVFEITEQAKAYQADPKYIFDVEPYPDAVSVENGEVCLNGEPVTLTPLPQCDEEYVMLSEPPPIFLEACPKVSDSIFVSLDELPAYLERVRREYKPEEHKEGEEIPWLNIDLSFEYKSADCDVNIVPNMLDYLMSRNLDREFTLQQDMLLLQRQADAIEQTVIMLMTISSFLLLIVLLAAVGLLQIYLYRRKKQMAVCAAYGSTAARLFAEIFAETFLVTGGGATLGLCALHFLMPYAVQLYSSAAFHPMCVFVAFGVAFVSALLSTALSLAGIGKISPAKILKNL